MELRAVMILEVNRLLFSLGVTDSSLRYSVVVGDQVCETELRKDEVDG